MFTEQTFFQTMRTAVETSLIDLWERFINFFPHLLGAIIVLIIGWIIAVAIGNLINRILKATKVNNAFERFEGLRTAFQRAGIRLDVAHFIGALVKWFLIIVFLLAASDILGLRGVSEFLNEVIRYVPNIIVAAIIVIAGVLFGGFVQRAIEASIEAANVPHARIAATVAKWAIYIFAFIAALTQLGVATGVLEMLVTGIMAMIAIAGGLAFGLGGKDLAQTILNFLKEDITRRRNKEL